MKEPKTPSSLFDDLENLTKTAKWITNQLRKPAWQSDYQQAVAFLKAYKGSLGTFNSYRREIEKLLQWTWHIASKSIQALRREDIERFVIFCQKPPKTWIGLKKATRFINKEGQRLQNPEWRPFVATLSKAAVRKGQTPDIKKFQLSQGSTKECFAILSSFFNYLLQEEYIAMNPVATIRQKSKFIRKRQGPAKIRRLSELQWQTVMEAATTMANVNPELHERTLFMMTALYSMYLRISELAASKRWIPSMNHFHRDQAGLWWFITVGKGNKERQIAVSDQMLAALKRYRQYLGLSALPSPADHFP